MAKRKSLEIGLVQVFFASHIYLWYIILTSNFDYKLPEINTFMVNTAIK